MKIICIGKNYAAHIKEIGDPVPENMVFFNKPDSSIVRDSKPFYIPDWTERIDYEVEIVVKINRVGKNIEKKFANKYYSEIGIGIDFTARDVQRKLKNNGHPWEKAKSFDGSAYYGSFIPMTQVKDIQDVNFRLEKNGEEVQNSNSSKMIYDVDTIIEEVSKYMTLKIGDLIFTGTPEGIGPVTPGDTLECFIEDDSLLKFKIK
ncbi:MAG: fumarylacetoacetate hydrolase family protein [Flavobacteriales bacterium]|nr:fumarylacetoacetate hydrolase family protein [Flavobacteriales bacterium]